MGFLKLQNALAALAILLAISDVISPSFAIMLPR